MTLRTVARWCAGPSIGITLGLALGTVADPRPAAPPPPVTLSVPSGGAGTARAPDSAVDDLPAHPTGVVVAAAGG